MTPQQLKNSILQMAIQGKLVEQRPEEGTGEELYQQIQKKKLAKEGKIKKQKPLPEITEDEIPFEIPRSWKWVRIGSVTELNPKNDVSDDVDASFIPMTLIDDGYRNHHTYEIKKWGSIKKGFTHFQNRDIGVAKITPCFQNRKSVIFKNLINGIGAGTTELSIVRSIEEYALPEFLLVYFKSEQFIIDGIKSFTGTAGQQRLHKDFLRTYLMPLPPLAEQKRIVTKIEEIMPFVVRYATAYDKLQSYTTRFPNDLKKSILHQAIQGKLIPQDPNDEPASVLLEKIAKKKKKLVKEGKIKKQKTLLPIIVDEIPFEIPENWQWVRWGKIVNIVSARRVHQSDWKTDGIPFYRAREIAKLADTGTVDNELFISQKLYNEFLKYCVPHPGDLMVTAVGTLGKTYIVHKKDIFYYKDASVICIENYGNLNSLYLKYVMQSEFMKNQIKSNSSGTTVSTLTITRMENYLIPVPPIAEQNRIVGKVEELLSQIGEIKSVVE